jgi:YVTN family beta-propeller protein
MNVTRLFVAAGLLTASACGGLGGTGLNPSQPPSSAVVASIPIGDYGTDVAVRSDGARAYVTLRTNKVLAIDTASRTVAATITTGGQPGGIALTPDGTRGYVMDMTAQNLFAIDARNAALLATVPVGIISQPLMTPSVAVAPDGRHAYLAYATSQDDHLLIVDTATNRIVKDQFLPIHPAGVAVSPDGTKVYVAGCKLVCINGTLLTLDATSASVTSTLALAAAPSGMVLDRGGKHAYVANGRDGSVAIVDLVANGVTSVSVSPQPVGIALHPNGRLLYVASFGTGRIDVVDTAAGNVVGEINVAAMPRAIAISPDGRFAYVTHSMSSVSVIDLAKAGGS